ncbi:MAG: mechanosensitive ion channel, partial [Candidatus Marinimicrobia bacterium]|nr:mechanosensitive ion channel [Candidatus Neomarinimicrobiota bacterium]
METLVQYLLDEGAIWLPRVIGVVAILAAFYVLAKVLKRVIITAAGRLQLDQNLIALFARVSSVMVMIFGLVTALGTVGVDVSALVAGLGLTGFA